MASAATGRLRSASCMLATIFAAIELGAAAILLYYRRQRELDALISRETLVASRATAAPANRRAVFGYARIHHLRVLVPAEGAAHGLAVDRESLGQLGDLARVRARSLASSSGSSSTSAIRLPTCSRLLHAETARGHGRRTETHAAGDERLFRVVRNRVLVDRDVRLRRAPLPPPCR